MALSLRSMDRDETKALRGDPLHRGLNGVDHLKGRSVGIVDNESRFAIAHARFQVCNLA